MKNRLIIFVKKFFNPLGLKNLSPAEIKRGVKRLTFKQVLVIALKVLAVFVLIIVGMIVYFSFNIPKPGELAQIKPVSSTKIFDRNGVLIKDVYDEEKRTVVDGKDIPDAAKNATVAVEDKDFYKHGAIDYRGIARAIYVDITHGSKSQGASTITQQLARNLIEGIGTKKTIARKIREAVVAYQFERIYDKDQILAYYLNQIPYGNNNYGIQAAANTYYGKNIQDLDPEKASDDGQKAILYAQVATLAAIPQAPSYYNPYGNHVDSLKIRRNNVLNKMADQGYISNDLRDKAKLISISEGLTQIKSNSVATHFIFYIKEQLVDLLGGGADGEKRLATGGYKVTTTLDLEKQKLAEQIITDKSTSIFKSTNASNIALLSTDAKTGQILAMVGSVDYNNKTFGSVNITTSLRQPGSSFKPIVYASLFKEGWSPGSTIFDVEGSYDQSKPDVIWPHNYSGGGRGALTTRYALGNSLNISAVKAQAIVGTSDAISNAQDLGITTLTEPDNYGLSMVLGSAEVKMTEMVGAYGVFATGGNLHPTSSIQKVEDSSGNVIQEWKDQPKTVIDPGIAYEISSILSDNGARTATFGGNSALNFTDRQVAVKTGTTSSYRDAWTIGYTPQIVTAVWVGNNDNKEMTHSGAGAMAAAPVWRDFMQKVLKDMPGEDFVRPDNVKDCSIVKYTYNKKPTDATPADDIIRDICTDSQQPKDADDIHQTVKVYRLDQSKLATDATPTDLVLNKIFTRIHSERPKDPVWENPVQAWAKSNGLNTESPPTDEYDPTTNDKLTVAVVSPIDGATVSGTINLQSTGASPFGVSLMTFYIDDVKVAEPNAPWKVSYDTTDLIDGKHTFKVVDRDLQGQESTATASFTTANNLTLAISNVIATRSVDKLSVTITWSSGVAASGNVVYGLTNTYGSTQNEGEGNVKSHSITITGLTATATYHYKVTSQLGTGTVSSADLTF
ncbi:MAG: transglycosylase domain-containing protein [Patescibacteria group bacterium]|jgi:membrane peptidoglycan carboxypeptidase